MHWNANGVLYDHCLLPEFLAEPDIPHPQKKLICNQETREAHRPIHCIEQQTTDHHMEKQQLQ